MEELLIALGVIALAAGLLVAYAATRPDDFRIARTVRIAAPPERVFAMIDDLRVMNTWNPFDKKQDPGIKGTYAGPASGVGARYEFDGRKAGAGHVEIIESSAPRHVAMRLVMTRPMSCDNRIDFSVAPSGAGSEVTWAMSGKSQLMGKLFGLLFNVDKMCGAAFEKGLADLKEMAEHRKAA